MTDTATAARPSDLARQIVVIASLCYMIVAAVVGVGGLGGTSVEDTQGGALSAQGSFLAPAGTAFSIWSVIYLGLIVYTLWQALPRQRSSDRQRAVGWWIALTMVLNGTWLAAAQFLAIWWTVVIIVVLLVALCIAFRRAVVSRMPDAGIVDSVLIDGVTGLHLGWVTLATVANIAAWLTDVGDPSWAADPALWGVGVLVAVLLIGIGVAWASGWRVTPGLAMGWGCVWIGIGRLVEAPRDGAIGWTAIVVGTIVAALPLAVTGLRAVRPSGD